MTDDAQLPADVDALKALLLEARAQLAERDIEIEQLKAQIDKLKRMQFGRKSEQLDRQIERLETELDELTGARGVADVRRTRASGTSVPVSATASKEALPPHLPREERVLESDLSCPNCGNPMQPLGEDVSEQLARVAAMFKVIARSGARLSVPAVITSRSRRCRACPLSAASRTRACWLTSSSRSSLTINRCTDSRRLPRATA